MPAERRAGQAAGATAGGGAGSLVPARVAVVTGASSGIGQAIARALGGAGFAVAVNYWANAGGAAETTAAIRAAGGRAVALQADVSDPEQVAELVRRARAEFGRIDVWVNNAGADILTGAAPATPELERLTRLWQVDVQGTFLCCRAVAPVMQEQGSGLILNMAWDHVLQGMAGPEAELYATAKGAIWAFSKSLARSLAPVVRVNVLAPGWIRTQFGAGLPPATAERIAAGTPMQRWGTPEDVAAAAVYLASPAADFVTGQTLVVNGGVVMF